MVEGTNKVSRCNSRHRWLRGLTKCPGVIQGIEIDGRVN